MSTAISLSSDQVKLVLTASEPIPVRSPQGEVVGWLMPRPTDNYFTPDEVAESLADLKSDMPRYTTEEVLARLRELK